MKFKGLKMKKLNLSELKKGLSKVLKFIKNEPNEPELKYILWELKCDYDVKQKYRYVLEKGPFAKVKNPKVRYYENYIADTMSEIFDLVSSEESEHYLETLSSMVERDLYNPIKEFNDIDEFIEYILNERPEELI
ncbi:hypothetical protein WCWAEYFT_CDS0112 [Vibrio phage VB_VaC_TDDLMA]